LTDPNMLSEQANELAPLFAQIYQDRCVVKQAFEIGRQWRYVSLDNIPNHLIVDVVIAMDDPIAQTSCAAKIGIAIMQSGINPQRDGESFTNDFA